MKIALLATLVVFGCGKSEPKHRSCTIPVFASCTDYTDRPDGEPNFSFTTLNKECTAFEGEWSLANCPTANQIATCTSAGDGWSMVTRSYSPKASIDKAKERCANDNGTFAPTN